MKENQLLKRITIDPAICHGKPCIRGLRYPVSSVLEYIAAGDSFEDILAEFSDLVRDRLSRRQCVGEVPVHILNQRLKLVLELKPTAVATAMRSAPPSLRPNNALAASMRSSLTTVLKLRPRPSLKALDT